MTEQTFTLATPQSDAATSADAIAFVKGHYVILDGLRGVAALMVVIFHLFEAYAGGNPQKQIINHGYLAVDFFFLLSGFVIAYAYDDRWAAGMNQWGFYKRRLVRLQPMIIMGSLIGAALVAFQHFSIFPKLEAASAWQIVAVMLLGCVMIPLTPSAEIRGWTEIYPLNGPAWSLFYEYVANILYAVGLRKLSNRAFSSRWRPWRSSTCWCSAPGATSSAGGRSTPAESVSASRACSSRSSRVCCSCGWASGSRSAAPSPSAACC
jgi:peptidoglycan/LPS O-acetylase OafA/YrhL